MSYHVSLDPRLEFSPGCRGLMIANAAVFLVGWAAPKLGYSVLSLESMLPLLALFPESLFEERMFWTPFTYMFLHAGPLHLAVNMMGLYFLGPDLEQVFGTKKFLGYYLRCGLVGALMFLGVSYGLQGQTLPVVGASGAIFGLLGGIVALYPSRVYLLLPLMIPIKASVLAVLLLSTHLFFILTPFGNHVAYDVHLGGGLTGFVIAGGSALLHRRRYRDVIPAPELPIARVELETLAYRIARGGDVAEEDRVRYDQLRNILRFEDIPTVAELRATAK